MNSFNELFRSIFGLPQKREGPINEFRNPIWGTDEDDEDDELYHTRREGDVHHPEVHIDIHTDPVPSSSNKFNGRMNDQMIEMFKSFGSLFSDMNAMFEDVNTMFGEGPLAADMMPGIQAPEDEGNIRKQYLKPGFRIAADEKRDGDLDGKISTDDIASLLKRKDQISEIVPKIPFTFDSNNQSTIGNRTSYFKTIITHSVSKPDGTVETRRIVRDQHGNVEETVTTQPLHTDNNNNNPNIFGNLPFWKIF